MASMFCLKVCPRKVPDDRCLMTCQHLSRLIPFVLAGPSGDELIQLPGLVPPLQDDTGDCTLILVFPRDRRSGGPIDHRKKVESPYELACKIFDNGDNPKSLETLKKLQYIEETSEEMEMELYQADIRSRFLEILGHSGIIVNHFTSLDKDEDFVTLTLPLKSSTIEFLAQRHGLLPKTMCFLISLSKERVK